MKTNHTLVLAAVLTLTALPAIAADTPAARIAQCIECHGENGVATSSGYPNLGGQHQDYLLKQLRDFRAGRRRSPFMDIVAAKLDEAEVENVAAYFARQNVVSDSVAANDATGRRLFLEGDAKRGLTACASCHGADARGAALVPALRGQQMYYLREQLLNWRAGQRSNSPGRVMNQASDALSDADIDALARYLSQL
ncbi:MAG: c-type cytochrome [Massilia sp.]